VLDLADDAVCRQVGVTPEQVRAEWRAPMEAYLAGNGPLPPTQQIGQAAHLTGRVRGIWFRSAREAGGSCLCVFPDRLSATDGDLLVVRGSYPQRLP
jgi:RES domain